VIERDAHDAIGGTKIDNDRGEDIFKAGSVGQFDGARRIKDGARRTRFQDAAVDKRDDSFADGVDFFAIVGDVQNRNSIGFVPGVKVFQDGAPQRRIEAGERLVEEQDAGAGDECSSERNALLFAPGEFPGPAGKKILDAKTLCDVVRAFALFGSGNLVEAVADILFHGEMREESERLKDVGQFAALRRKRVIAGGVKENFFAEADLAGVGPLQACNAIEQRGFARAGRAEQHGEAWRISGGDVQDEGLHSVRAKLLADLNVQHSEVYFTGQGDQTRRFMP